MTNKYAQYEPTLNRPHLAQAVSDYLLGDGWLTEHKYTREFEKSLRQYLEVEYCSVVNNGTIAISLALKAIDAEVGDFVIVPNLTMVATATACQLIGCFPVFVDVEEDSLCMSYEALISAINNIPVPPKAIIYVSLNGRVGNDFIKIKDYCRANRISLIEDAAQSLGSDGAGYRADITTFSFSMHKTITTGGQGGAIVTNNPVLANKVRALRDFGRESLGRDNHIEFGINSKFTEIQAIIGLCQLNMIEEIVLAKKNLWFHYWYLLKDVKEIEFIRTDTGNVCPWFIDIYTEYRDELARYLLDNNISTREVYPTLDLQPCFGSDATLKEINDLAFPISRKYSKRGLWLPSTYSLTSADVTLICGHIIDFFTKKGISDAAR